eukprot:gene27119-2347_t
MRRSKASIDAAVCGLAHAHSVCIHQLTRSYCFVYMSADAAVDQLSASNKTPMEKYLEGRERDLYREDPRQELTVSHLQDLYDKLAKHVSHPPPGRKRPSGLTMVDTVSNFGSGHSSTGGGWWSSLVGGGKHSGSKAHPHPHSGSAHGIHPEIEGLYMYGGVGCGKTMLMDMFVNCAPPEFKVKRIHFHEFMLDVHQKMHKLRGVEDPLLRVADQLSQETKVLALDEFFVTDVADASILSRLFSRMWDRNVGECKIHDMASGTDYRKLACRQQGLFFTSADREKLLEEQFLDLAQGVGVFPATVEVMMGRVIQVPKSTGKTGKICMFSFEDLCGKPVAAADYLAITEAYHTVVISGVPVFTGMTRPHAYRFVTLVDVLYEHRVRLICSAEGTPLELLDNIITQQESEDKPHLKERPEIVVDDNLGFSKDRTVSRLTEMQSIEYLLAHAELHAPCNLLALQQVRDTGSKKANVETASLGLTDQQIDDDAADLRVCSSP